mmetsp:Transcript_23315/g.42162  ORF Transcript_23315/g.42162 Transcript_23315/m.42162 type:complete len:211 (+) Transcript_23315:32-664(+)
MISRGSSTSFPVRKGPSRFYYDRKSYTGVHTNGGPDPIVNKDSYIMSLRGALHGHRDSAFEATPGLQRSSNQASLGRPNPKVATLLGEPTPARGPERFFYDKSTYTGVYAKGGPCIIDSYNNPDKNFFHSLRPGHHSGATGGTGGSTLVKVSGHPLQKEVKRPSDSCLKHLRADTNSSMVPVRRRVRSASSIGYLTAHGDDAYDFKPMDG